MPTPSQLGFRMPAEWHPHRRCWMAWPCREATWPNGLDAAREAYAAVAAAISDFEPVTMVCPPADVAEASLTLGRGIDVAPLAIDDSWIRDSGPTFLIDGKGGLAVADWRFNAWGGNYPDHDRDATLAARIADRLGLHRFEAPIVLEGGAVHVDGEGTVLAVATSILNPNRNPGLEREAVERVLNDHLGTEHVIWLPEGHVEDETDGHVDEVACFARPGLVLAMDTDDESDPNHRILKRNLEILSASTDARGRALEVVTLPSPPARRHADGRRMTLSYVNFYLPNGGLVFPRYEVSEDDRALRILREVFPDREVVGVAASDIVPGGGNIHCITQQEPVPIQER